MKKIIGLFLMLSAVSAFAATECTTEPKAKWQDESRRFFTF